MSFGGKRGGMSFFVLFPNGDRVSFPMNNLENLPDDPMQVLMQKSIDKDKIFEREATKEIIKKGNEKAVKNMRKEQDRAKEEGRETIRHSMTCIKCKNKWEGWGKFDPTLCCPQCGSKIYEKGVIV